MFHHIPVLATEIIEGLQVRPNGCYLDVTLGGGGHSELILQTLPSVKLVGIDRDQQAICATKERLVAYGDRVSFWQGNYADYQPRQKFDGIIADLGVSSVHLDVADRGFSFRNEAHLDMRMDNSQELTAAEIVNYWKEKDIADVIFRYGEERLSRQIARKIVENRPITTTTALAEIISGAVPKAYRYGRIHPATRTFQGLRIAVNEELSSLEKLLKLSPRWLKSNGRMGVISFHSLEDRMVKHTWRENPALKVLTKKPIIAQEEEIRVNPRARSAKLRWVESTGI